ncbi:hypothetical protein BTVI_17760 [Pitangus sulphuratus]|nr:hypothetical protein BTVI_17760 [Pitangus sulphuratus]
MSWLWCHGNAARDAPLDPTETRTSVAEMPVATSGGDWKPPAEWNPILDFVDAVAPLLAQLLASVVGVAAPQELAWISFWILHLWKIIFAGNFPVAAL